jgi:hypothetical protein
MKTLDARILWASLHGAQAGDSHEAKCIDTSSRPHPVRLLVRRRLTGSDRTLD